MESLVDALRGVLVRQERPDIQVIVLAGVIAGAVVIYRPTWQTARHVVTIAHEASHGIAALGRVGGSPESVCIPIRRASPCRRDAAAAPA
ncbi:MAG TPA: M50 family metallopeptidase [Nocardioidaceae bacterium]|nr:M50 family metallopeptidase [Nocardioidaceae bacterium]